VRAWTPAYRIEFDTSAVHDQSSSRRVAGKFDIGGSARPGAPTPDQKLDFVAKVTDGDGDSNTAGFSIGIDGTGPLTTAWSAACRSRH
jgi:hypothetical protein